MKRIRTLLNIAFPWMALSGLFLAGWGIIATPDNIKGGKELAEWRLQGSGWKTEWKGSWNSKWSTGTTVVASNWNWNR